MRTVKISIAVTILVALGVFAYSYYSAPARWIAETRRESIEVLTGAKSVQQLEEAVKPYGVFVQATDGSWVAVRYRDTHYISPIQALAIAKDSGGRWFACDRHFCGWLTSFARERARGQDPSVLRDMFPATGGRKEQAGYEKMETLFAATNLDALRVALTQMDFQEFTAK
jgi:hypothetical protein